MSFARENGYSMPQGEAMSPRRTLIYVIAAAAIATAAACGGKSKSSSPSSGVSITSASSGATATSGGGQAASSSEIQAFASALAKVKSFRATITSAGAITQDGTVEVLVPDKFHITSGQLELISIGSDAWVKSNGTWLKAPAGAPVTAFFQPNQLSALAASIQAGQVTKGGTDTVNGKKCQLYTTNSSDGSVQEFCVADNLPLRIATTNGPSKTTIVFTEIDKPVDIKAPI
jgi:hypothetical protein